MVDFQDDLKGLRDQAASRLIDGLQEAKRFDSWHWAFRASGLPLCQLQVLWFELDERLHDLPRREQSYLSDFFMAIGTAAHTVTQRWLGRQGVLFGHWFCPVCKKVYGPVLGPVRCDDHDHLGVVPTDPVETQYQEFEFLDLPSGHCDGLLKLWDMTPGEKDFVLLEIKTTQRNKLDKIKAQDFPFNYRLQALTYCKKLKDRGYNIVDTLFLFIPRDYPRDITPVWFRPKRVDEISQSILQDYEAAIRSFDHHEFSQLTGICGTIEDARTCPYRVNCFSPSAKKIFADRYRQCFDRACLEVPQFPASE